MKYEILIFILLVNAMVLYQVVWKCIREAWVFRKFSETSLKTTGVVIDCHVVEDSDNNKKYARIVEYSLHGKGTFILYDNDFKLKPPKKGEEVIVHYHEDQPKGGLINLHSKIKYRIWMAVIYTVGVVVGSIGVYYY